MAWFVQKRIGSDWAPSDERNIAAVVRAVDYEFDHLESPSWKRNVYWVFRNLGALGAGKVLGGGLWRSSYRGDSIE
jgi:hypothetical protein